jgi:hypothetical protein
MALRQTILTTLISTDEEADTYPSQFNKVIIDLTDPILSATKLDAAIFNIILRDFATTGTGEAGLIGEMRRMIHITIAKSISVINNAHEFLRSDSLLLKSILSLAASRDGSHSVLLTALNLLSIDPALISLSAYMIRGYPNPRSWIDYYQLHGPSGLSFPQKSEIQAGQIVIVTRVVVLPSPNRVYTEEARSRFIRGVSDFILLNIEELDTIPYQEDILSPLHITESQREEGYIEVEPSRGMFSPGDVHSSPASASPLDPDERFTPLDPNLAENSAPSFSEKSYVVSGGGASEVYPNQGVAEPSVSMDRDGLLSLLINQINNHSRVRR